MLGSIVRELITTDVIETTDHLKPPVINMSPLSGNDEGRDGHSGNRNKDQLGDVLHWIRQIVALVCGLLWGTVPLVGGIWLVAFLLISSGIIYGYYAIILKVDEEEFGGHGPLLQEGLFASVTLFLLAWTLVYSLAHF
ncbi:hypothetical protein R6Q57_010954 [Mikania cordata]